MENNILILVWMVVSDPETAAGTPEPSPGCLDAALGCFPNGHPLTRKEEEMGMERPPAFRIMH